MPIFGHSTHPGHDLVKEINEIAKLGFDFVEISMEPPNANYDDVMKIKGGVVEALKKFRHPPTCHAPWWMQLGSDDITERAAWIVETKKIVDTCSAIGVCRINIHVFAPGFAMLSRSDKRDTIDNFVGSFGFLVEYSKKRNVIIHIENTWEEPEDFAKILLPVEGLKATIDVGHAFMEGGFGNIEKFAKRFKDRIELWHFHDNHGKADSHLPIGKGKIPFPRVAKLLADYSGGITLEVHSPDRKLSEDSLKKLRELWK